VSLTLTPVTPAIRTVEIARRRSPHPVSPLSAGEVATAIRVLRAELALPAAARFVAIELRRLSPAAIAARRPGEAADRDAVVVIEDPEVDATYEAVVSVDDGFVRSLRRLDA
jgi:primary-amine oxidase